MQKIISKDLPKIVEDLKHEIQHREESDSTIMKKFSEEIAELGKTISS